MKSLFTFLAATLIVLSFSVLGFAQNMTAPAGPVGNQTYGANGGQVYASNEARTGSGQRPALATENKMEPGENVMIYTGKVASIDRTNHTMVVKGDEGDKTFDVSGAATEWIQPGNDVNVTYHQENGKMMASYVDSGAKTSSLEGPPYGYDGYPA